MRLGIGSSAIIPLRAAAPRAADESRVMQPLSEQAIFILGQMEPNRSYDAAQIRAFVPDVSMERLREIMHELWVHRRVERHGFTAWRKERSGSGSPQPPTKVAAAAPRPESRCAHGDALAQTKAVKPEDLFDHDSFSGFFK